MINLENIPLKQNAKEITYLANDKGTKLITIKYAKENFNNKIDDIFRNQETGNSSRTFWQVMGRFMGKWYIN